MTSTPVHEHLINIPPKLLEYPLCQGSIYVAMQRQQHRVILLGFALCTITEKLLEDNDPSQSLHQSWNPRDLNRTIKQKKRIRTNQQGVLKVGMPTS